MADVRTVATSGDTGIYQIVNTLNGRTYIGSAVSLKKRWREHVRQLRKGIHHSKFMQRCWAKHGESAFVFEPLLFCDKESLIENEQIAIDQRQPEYNSSPTAGSQLGFRMSDESKAKLAAAARRTKNFSGKQHSEESRKKISESRRGKGLGQMTPERRKKIGQAHKGKVISPEQRAKISATLTGRKQSSETIEKRAAKLRGRKMPEGFAEAQRQRLLGSKWTDEMRKNYGLSRGSLTDIQVREVRDRIARGHRGVDIAKDFDVTAAIIYRIKHGHSYTWVK